MLSQYWTHDHEKMKKRARQVDFVVASLDAKKGEWFFFDIIYQCLVYLNATFKWLWTVTEPDSGLPKKTKKKEKNINTNKKTNKRMGPLGATNCCKSNGQRAV